MIAILVSCQAPKITHIPQSSTFYGINFSKYSNKKFLFTPYKYLGDYKSIGLITYKVLPEAKLVQAEKYKDINGNSIVENVWKTEIVNPENAIEMIYKKALEMGANAVVDFKITPISISVDASPPVTLNGIEVSGFAINRLGAFK